MNIWGLHLANDDGKNPEAEIEQVVGTGVSHFTLLDFQADNAQRLRQASPSGTILIRFYLPNWRATDPIQWARDCAERYLRVRDGGWSLASIGAAVTPANEQNLVVEGGNDSKACFEQTAYWNGVWLTEFQRLTSIPKALTHWPAWAYGNQDDYDGKGLGYTGIDICRDVIHRYGVFDGHPYWPTGHVADYWYGQRYQLWHERLPDMPIFCSELCCPDVMLPTAIDELLAWFKNAEQVDYITGGTTFIVRDPHHSMMNNDLSRNPAVMAAIKAAPKAETGVTVMSSAEVERYAQDIWARFKIAVNPNSALYKAWLAAFQANKYYGVPLEAEHRSENGRYIIQAFANTILYWDSQSGQVGTGLPLA